MGYRFLTDAVEIFVTLDAGFTGAVALAGVAFMGAAPVQALLHCIHFGVQTACPLMPLALLQSVYALPQSLVQTEAAAGAALAKRTAVKTAAVAR